MHREFPDRKRRLIIDDASTHTAYQAAQYEEDHVEWLRIEILPGLLARTQPDRKRVGLCGDQGNECEQTKKVIRRLKHNRELVKVTARILGVKRLVVGVPPGLGY